MPSQNESGARYGRRPSRNVQTKKTPGGVSFRSHLLLFTIISMDILAQASPYCNGKTLPIYCQFSANFLPPSEIVFCPVHFLISKYQQVSEIARLFASFYFKSLCSMRKPQRFKTVLLRNNTHNRPTASGMTGS